MPSSTENCGSGYLCIRRCPCHCKLTPHALGKPALSLVTAHLQLKEIKLAEFLFCRWVTRSWSPLSRSFQAVFKETPVYSETKPNCCMYCSWHMGTWQEWQLTGKRCSCYEFFGQNTLGNSENQVPMLIITNLNSCIWNSVVAPLFMQSIWMNSPRAPVEIRW